MAITGKGKNTVKQCEWNTNENDRCPDAGIIFYRAASGWGHWLCPMHRDAWKRSDKLRTASPEERWNDTYKRMGDQ
jgi:hypothetical protein